jgi:hypothetical protein
MTWKNTGYLASRTEFYGHRDRARPVPVTLRLDGRCKAGVHSNMAGPAGSECLTMSDPVYAIHIGDNIRQTV